MRRLSISKITLLAVVGTLAAPVAARAGGAAGSGGEDFVDQARLFHRVVACGSDTAVPKGFDAKVVREHCRALRRQMRYFREHHAKRVQRFMAKWRPNDLPHTVVYPFGGGDLITALLTYPNATDITTISLEHPGDPRRLHGMSSDDLAANLALYNLVAGELIRNRDSSSKNMRLMERGPIPGQLGLFMLALAIMDYEPVSLRFFRIEPDGSLHYYTGQEIEALDHTQAEKLEERWINTDYSVAFQNSELAFRRRGAGPEDPIIIHRHIAWNLDNEHFGGSPLEKYLDKKGKVASMTKAASYLLWTGNFSAIRDYMLENSVWMVSDATGPLPNDAAKFGFEQITFGTFTDAYLEWSRGKRSDRMRELWESQKKRNLTFRYGYPDAAGNVHLMITRPRKK